MTQWMKMLTVECLDCGHSVELDEFVDDWDDYLYNEKECEKCMEKVADGL